MRLSARLRRAEGAAPAPAPATTEPAPRRAPPRLKAVLFHLLEGDGLRDWRNVVFDWAMILLIGANVAAFAAETVPALDQRYHAAFAVFDGVSIAIFTLEYLARLWVCTEHLPPRRYTPWRARAMFATRPFMVIDLLVILPYYLSMLLALDLRVLRVLRLLRFLKLARFSPAIELLLRVIYVERRALFGTLVLLAGLVILAATLMYVVERQVQPDHFGSVPDSMWWAIVTLATVGYGDVVPVTSLGKLIAGVVMVFGLAMFALPISILATGFVAESHRREFVVTWSMVARVPLFAHLDAEDIGDVVRLLRSEIVPQGTVIVRAGEPAESMYFITSGEVDVELPTGPVRLLSGDFFGEGALVHDAMRSATVVAVTRCDILVVEVEDFRRLMRHKPQLRQRVQDALSRAAESRRAPPGDIVPEELNHEPPRQT